MIEKLALDGSSQLFTYGPLGICFALFALTIWWLGKELIASYRARIAENRESVEALRTAAESISKMRDTVDLNNRALQDGRDFDVEMGQGLKSLESISTAGIKRVTEQQEDLRRLILERTSGGVR